MHEYLTKADFNFNCPKIIANRAPIYNYDELYFKNHPKNDYKNFVHDSTEQSAYTINRYADVNTIVCHDSYYYAGVQDFVAAHVA